MPKSQIVDDARPLMIVSCGKAKVWDKNPTAAAVPAREAYTSSLFKLCRRYAEVTAGRHWVILSAKYGFLTPDELINSYNTVFGKGEGAITTQQLRKQWRHKYPAVRRVISLASKKYNDRLADTVPKDVVIETPLARYNLFQRTAWLAQAVNHRPA